MKICPKCQKTYSDESLNFCLEDGTVLSQQTAGVNIPPPETVLMNQPRQTFPPRQFADQPQQNDWETVPKYPTQKAESSKSWLWVAGILGALALVCGGGLIGLIALIASIETNGEDSNNISNTFIANVKNTNSPPDDRKNITTIDLSGWNQRGSQFGSTDYKNSELVMNAKRDKFYYVLVAPAAYKTENATTGVTVRNINNGENSLGYGLIFHSNPTPLKQGYAFLIDSKNQKYRIVRHKPQKEDDVVGWTKSDSINEGARENVLTVRDEKESVNFYINGSFVTSIRNTDGYKGGVAGLYVGGMSPVGFSNLEIKR